MPEDMPTLLLDCHYLGHQAHYTLGGLSHEDVATGVIFGFLSRMLSLGEHFQTNDIVFCWDSPLSYRKRRYPWYKGKRRAKGPEEEESLEIMHSQLRKLRKKILPEIGFNNQIIQDGCESDDLMAIVVMGKLGEFIIITADEDLFQCLQANTRIYNPSKKKMMTRQKFKDLYGIQPRDWAEVKAVAGCNSDNVPGIEGVGNKTALRWLKGELTKGKKYDDIMAGSGIIERNRRLVTLPISKAQEPVLAHNTFSMEGFREVCEEYGLGSFLMESNLAQWECLFKSPITQSEGLLYNKPRRKVRPPRRKRG